MEARSLGPVGLEILSLDLSVPVDQQTGDRLQALLLEGELLVFRDQHLPDAGFVEFARRFGSLEGGRFAQQPDATTSEIVVLSNALENDRPIGVMDVGQYWHSDGTFLPVPDMYTMLYGVEIPSAPDGSPLGDTLFVSATRAWADLPDDTRARLAGLQAVSSYEYRFQLRLARNPALASARARTAGSDPRHPIARPHPLTGKVALFVNEGYTTRIEGLPQEESDAWLKMLYAHLYRPDRQYRHRWRPGDLLVWDNNATQHCAISDYRLPQVRRMKRVSVKEAPSTASEQGGC